MDEWMCLLSCRTKFSLSIFQLLDNKLEDGKWNVLETKFSQACDETEGHALATSYGFFKVHVYVGTVRSLL